MTNAVLGIDVSKNTFDTNLGVGTKARSKSFANSPDGWHHLIAWLGEHKIGQVHACLEATGRHGLGIAVALHEAGHVVSIVNPAQIRRAIGRKGAAGAFIRLCRDEDPHRHPLKGVGRSHETAGHRHCLPDVARDGDGVRSPGS
jgi:hypothetical protein